MSFIELYQKSQYLKVWRYHRLTFFMKITGKNLQFLNAELFVELRCDLRLIERKSLARINRLAASDWGIDFIVSIRNCSDLYVVSIKWSYCSISFVICSIWSDSLRRLPSWETAKNRDQVVNEFNVRSTLRTWEWVSSETTDMINLLLWSRVGIKL